VAVDGTCHVASERSSINPNVHPFRGDQWKGALKGAPNRKLVRLRSRKWEPPQLARSSFIFILGKPLSHDVSWIPLKHSKPPNSNPFMGFCSDFFSLRSTRFVTWHFETWIFTANGSAIEDQCIFCNATIIDSFVCCCKLALEKIQTPNLLMDLGRLHSKDFWLICSMQSIQNTSGKTFSLFFTFLVYYLNWDYHSVKRREHWDYYPLIGTIHSVIECFPNCVQKHSITLHAIERSSGATFASAFNLALYSRYSQQGRLFVMVGYSQQRGITGL
jgi:hypothetical protein